MTKEQYERLKPYEHFFTTAIEGSYIRSLTNKEINVLIDVAHELGIDFKNNHCPSCILTFVKKVGKLYRSYVPEPTPVQDMKTTLGNLTDKVKQTTEKLWQKSKKSSRNN